MSDNLRIGLLLYGKTLRSSVHGILEFFEAATEVGSRESTIKTFEVLLFSEDQTLVPQGMKARRLRKDANLDVVIVPPQSKTPNAHECSEGAARWLQEQAAAESLITSACVGAFLLAEAGLLDGKRATTHWLLADTFRTRYPLVTLEEEAMVVDEGSIITAGGVTAWLDLALLLLHRLSSPSIAATMGKYFLVDTGLREQKYYRMFQPKLDHGDEAVTKAQRYLHSHFRKALSNAEIAKSAHLSVRTLQRRFCAVTGESTTSYLRKLRLQKACEYLETTRKAVDDIVFSVGYEDASAFRRVFREELGITPGQYRRRFSLVAA
ncbi:MAG: helix-turn-helix domain-containing protein [Polyangiaceae bacterium]|nr:helix-turn-helix domain-containing protein [Polyangiaceae bacterium]